MKESSSLLWLGLPPWGSSGVYWWWDNRREIWRSYRF